MGLGGQWDQSGVEAQVRTGVLGVGVSGWFEPLQLFGVVLALSKRVLANERMGWNECNESDRSSHVAKSPRRRAAPSKKFNPL